MNEVSNEIKSYTKGIKNIEKRISELKEQNEELTTGNFKEHPRINRGGSKLRQIVKDAFKVGELSYQFEVIDVEDG